MLSVKREADTLARRKGADTSAARRTWTHGPAGTVYGLAPLIAPLRPHRISNSVLYAHSAQGGAPMAAINGGRYLRCRGVEPARRLACTVEAEPSRRIFRPLERRVFPAAASSPRDGLTTSSVTVREKLRSLLRCLVGLERWVQVARRTADRRRRTLGSSLRAQRMMKWGNASSTPARRRRPPARGGSSRASRSREPIRPRDPRASRPKGRCRTPPLRICGSQTTS